MKLHPRLAQAVNNVIVAAVTVIIVLVWQQGRWPTQEERREIAARVKPFELWREQSKEAWGTLTRERPSLNEVQFAVSARDGVISVSVPKLSDDDELTVYRFILDHPPPSPLRLTRTGVTTK
jgi:hypothetical protein